MKRSLVGLAVAGALFAAATSLRATEKRGHMDSPWRSAAIDIDGSPLDWPGPLVPFNDQPVSVAATNDGDSLFLVLTASDRGERMLILRRGLIVWFDPDGKDKKRFGVKFPVGVPFTEEDFGGHRHGGGGPPNDPSGTGDSSGASSQSRQSDSSLEPPNRLEILGASKDDARSFTADKVPGIQVKVGQAEGLLTYELKVPLLPNDAHPYAIGTKPGASIGVGLEMPKLEMPANGGEGRGPGGGGGGGGGGMGGHGGGMGGHGGGMGGRGGGMGGHGGGTGGHDGTEAQQVKPLTGWITVKLAAS